MALIKKAQDTTTDLLTITVEGNLSAQEIIDFGPGAFESQCSLVIWDISQGSVSEIATEEVVDVAGQIKILRSGTKTGRTALVANKTADFGILRMYSAYAESKNPNIDYEVFYGLEEAKEWILA